MTLRVSLEGLCRRIESKGFGSATGNINRSRRQLRSGIVAHVREPIEGPFRPEIGIIEGGRLLALFLVIGHDEIDRGPAWGRVSQRPILDVQADQHRVDAVARHRIQLSLRTLIATRFVIVPFDIRRQRGRSTNRNAEIKIIMNRLWDVPVRKKGILPRDGDSSTGGSTDPQVASDAKGVDRSHGGASIRDITRPIGRGRPIENWRRALAINDLERCVEMVRAIIFREMKVVTTVREAGPDVHVGVDAVTIVVPKTEAGNYPLFDDLRRRRLNR